MNTSEEVHVQGQAFRMACRGVNFARPSTFRNADAVNYAFTTRIVMPNRISNAHAKTSALQTRVDGNVRNIIQTIQTFVSNWK